MVRLNFKLWNFLMKTRKEKQNLSFLLYLSSTFTTLPSSFIPEEQLFPDLKFNIKWDTDTEGRGESWSLPGLYLIARPSQNLWTVSQKNIPCSQLHEELNIFWLYWNILRIIFLCWHPLLSAFMVNNDQ